MLNKIKYLIINMNIQFSHNKDVDAKGFMSKCSKKVLSHAFNIYSIHMASIINKTFIIQSIVS